MVMNIIPYFFAERMMLTSQYTFNIGIDKGMTRIIS